MRPPPDTAPTAASGHRRTRPPLDTAPEAAPGYRTQGQNTRSSSWPPHHAVTAPAAASGHRTEWPPLAMAPTVAPGHHRSQHPLLATEPTATTSHSTHGPFWPPNPQSLLATTCARSWLPRAQCTSLSSQKFLFERPLRHAHPTRLSLFQQCLLGTRPGHSSHRDPRAARPRLRLCLALCSGLGCLGCLGFLGSRFCLGCSRSLGCQLGLGLGFLLFLQFVL